MNASKFQPSCLVTTIKFELSQVGYIRNRLTMQNAKLQLVPLDVSNWRNALQVRTTPKQLAYVADFEPVALVILAKSYVRPGNLDWYPLAIMLDNEIVGVVALAHNSEHCMLYHLVIDSSKQGQGLGKASIAVIVDYIRENFSRCNTVSLTVHQDNHLARHIYLSFGFQTTGKMRDFESVLEYVL